MCVCVCVYRDQNNRTTRKGSEQSTKRWCRGVPKYNKSTARNRSKRGGRLRKCENSRSAVFVRPGPLTMDVQPRRTNGSCAVTLCWQMSIRYFPKKKIKLGSRWTIGTIPKRLSNRINVLSHERNASGGGGAGALLARSRSTDHIQPSSLGSAAALGC